MIIYIRCINTHSKYMTYIAFITSPALSDWSGGCVNSVHVCESGEQSKPIHSKEMVPTWNMWAPCVYMYIVYIVYCTSTYMYTVAAVPRKDSRSPARANAAPVWALQLIHTCQPSRVSLDCPGFRLFVPASRFSSDCPGNRALVRDSAHYCMMCVIWKSIPAMAESSSSAARGGHSY